jgi:transposase
MKDFDREFKDDASCLEWIKNHRWPDGIHCVECKKVTKHHRVTGRSCYSCDYCGHQVFPLANTIFHKSSTSLRTWFHAIFLMASTRCGISAKQVQRETGVTYKTAWRMFTQIRTLLDDNLGLLSGPVEVDEAYIGGKGEVIRGRGAEHKTIVAGVVERKGSVKASVVPNVRAKTLSYIIQDSVKLGSTVYTDDMPSYQGLLKNEYDHKVIKHLAKVYIDGDVHTCTIDGFWSLLKRGIDGVYHAVSPKYLQQYVNEYSFRYNHRKDEQPMFTSFLNQIEARKKS